MRRGVVPGERSGMKVKLQGIDGKVAVCREVDGGGRGCTREYGGVSGLSGLMGNWLLEWISRCRQQGYRQAGICRLGVDLRVVSREVVG